MAHRKSSIHCSCTNALYPAQAIQWNKCNLTRFSTNFKFEVFSECFRGPLKTLWLAICSPRACSLDHTDIIKPCLGNLCLTHCVVCYVCRLVEIYKIQKV